MNARPPKRPLQFLRWFCREDYLDEIEGDLIEIFNYQHEQSPSKARRQFLWNVLKHCRPEFIKSFNLKPQYNPTIMIRNNFKISFRNLVRNRNYAFIN
ncbi:MAG TPA: permease prefix domain 2-containing transporter, partial [Puia sp.]|nr:permease prefix domain 2-containing transporter [Puia sp.]